jgi:hypothetical protein
LPVLLRPYQPGDERAIVELSNRCLAAYAGWVPRTVDYWRWSILQRPDVGPTDILLLDSGGQILGYTVLGRDGSVLDFCVDPEQPSRGRRTLIERLIAGLEERARARHCDTLTFSEPSSDRLVDQALRESGYVVDQPHCFSLGVLNPLSLLQQLLLARGAQLPKLQSPSFVFELNPGPYPFLLNSRLLLQLEPQPQVRDISDLAEYPQECVLRMDLCALTELLLCGVTVDSLLQQSQLEIRPAAHLADARKLLDVLAIRSLWHIPRSDGF